MTRDEARAILDRVITSAREGEIEASIGGGESHLTRFANNEITQNVSEKRHVLSVRAVLGKRTGRASGNDLSAAGIERLVRAAEEAARLQPEIPDLPPLPGPQSYRAAEPRDEATAKLGPEARAREVSRAIARCREAGVMGAGIYESGVGSIGDYGEIDALAIAN